MTEGKFETGNAVRDTITHDQTGRMLSLYKDREKNRKELELAMAKIDRNTSKRKKVSEVDSTFTGSAADKFEEEFRKSTVGLVSVEQFREKRRHVDEMIRKIDEKPEQVKRKLIQKVSAAKLSFNDGEDGEEDEDQQPPKKKGGYLGKNPTVDTSFLPDESRADQLEKKKQELTEQWKAEQERIKEQKILVDFSYWDGVGHPRVLVLPKGTTVLKFLVHAKFLLEKEFPELRPRSPATLLFVKEDLIIPTHLTFYDLMRSDAVGRTGKPLFNFDTTDEEEFMVPTKLQKTADKYPGKVVCRRWFLRNQHVYPVSRWEHFDPTRPYERSTEQGEFGRYRYTGDARGENSKLTNWIDVKTLSDRTIN